MTYLNPIVCVSVKNKRRGRFIDRDVDRRMKDSSRHIGGKSTLCPIVKQKGGQDVVDELYT